MKTYTLLAFSLSALQLFSLSSRAGVIAIPASATQTQIQATITGAAAGDTITFAAGATYTLTQTLNLKNGITLDGNGCIWDATAQSSILRLVNTASLKNVTIKNATAKNIMFRFWVNGMNFADINNINIVAIRFQDGKAEASPDTVQVDSRYLQIKGSGITIAECQFLRTSATPGKAVQLYCAQNITFTGCLVGTTRTDGADCDTYGWFKTAININYDSVLGNPVLNTVITANKIYRTTAMDEATENCDHGIYAHHFDGLEISGNTISGWPASATGGALKLRNAKNFKICNNLLLRSGILLYTYNEGAPPPPFAMQYLQNGVITGNTIKLDAWTGDADMYHGIGYWRNTGNSSDPAESSIRIAGNALTNAGISFGPPVNIAGWNTSGGGIFDNTITGGSIAVPSGIAQSGNTITSATPAGARVSTLLTTLSAVSATSAANTTNTVLPHGSAYALSSDLVYTANPVTHTIDQLNPDTGVTTIQAGAPGSPGDNDGRSFSARFNAPSDLATDMHGNLYIADTGNHTIRKIDNRTGQVTTLAGRPGIPGHDDGPGASATLTAPDAIHIAPDGNIYIADNNGTILRLLQIAPIITKHPLALSATTGATITLAAEATAAPTPGYQWYHDGTPIANATTGTLTLSNLSVNQTGNYTLTARNTLGADTSAPAQVALAAIPASPTPATNTTSNNSGDGGGAPSALYLLALASLVFIRRRH